MQAESFSSGKFQPWPIVLLSMWSSPSDVPLQVKADAPEKKGFGSKSKKRQKAKAKQEEQSRPYRLQAQPEQTPAQDLEASTVKFLAVLFVIFICEGIFLAIAVSSTSLSWQHAIKHYYKGLPQWCMCP